MENVFIGTRRELFWDEYLVDPDMTTAFPRLNEPVRRECCYLFDQGEEMNAISYPCVVKDDKGYKMYYLPWKSDFAGCYVAVLESIDGLHWTRPQLNLFDHPELKENNVVIDHTLDGVFVFYDTNPDCPEEERYKAVGSCYAPYNGQESFGGLWCYTSPDGYHFKCSYLMTDCGAFDSLNTVHWDGKRYACYLRNYHKYEDGVSWDGFEDFNNRTDIPFEAVNRSVRDIRVMYSEDFRSWTKPELISFDDGLDYPLYTNNVEQYERAPHVLIGFPTRYCERTEWTPNNDQIGSAAVKKHVMESHEKRSGLAVTDCIFMCSHDGKMWHRYNEAFLTPGYEHEHNWVYGDCYPAYGMIDSGREVYYMYTKDWHRSQGYPKPLNRYEIRKDGFACYMADGRERVLVTRPLVFEGKDLHLNFASSAYGYIYVDVLDDEGNELSGKRSFEIYGDTLDRCIGFADGTDFSEYAGRPVRLRFKMRDAKLFSMKFE